MTDRVAIVGSRTLVTENDRALVFKVVRRLARNDPEVVIISGGARGVDSFAAEASSAVLGRRAVVHLPDYAKYARSAPFMRNQVIVDDATKLVACWDGVSGGTIDAVRRAYKKDIPVFFWYAPLKKWSTTRDAVLELTGPLERARPARRRRDDEGATGAPPATWVGMYQLKKRLERTR